MLAKRLGAGFAARAAVLAAFLAKDGLTGTRRTLEVDAGLFSLHECGGVKLDRRLDDWGRTGRIPEYSFKPFPGCRCNHTAIGLGIRLHREGVRADQVDGIEIGLGNLNWPTVGQPYEDPEVKLRGCLASGLSASAAQASRLVEAVRAFEHAPDTPHDLINAFPTN